MSTGRSSTEWRAGPVAQLGERAAHVWRIQLRAFDPRELIGLLSHDERERAERFYHERDAHAYVVSHGMLRRILARYDERPPSALSFIEGPKGKPALVSTAHSRSLEFNLSHSGDLALVAVTRRGPVGVDVEQWDRAVEHLALAEHFFSPVERDALRSLAHDLDQRTEGFFNAWTRKEAYLKATGHGITRGLHHFDVSLSPTEPAALLADRLDPLAVQRWRVVALAAGDGYAAAVVVANDIDEIARYDAESAA